MLTKNESYDLSTKGFRTDLRLWFSQMNRDHLVRIVATVAAMGRLPTMAVRPGAAEAVELLLASARHVNGETTFVGGALETHMRSVISRSLGRVASALSLLDLTAQHMGTPLYLTSDQWREVYRALLNGCAGRAPVLCQNGSLTPPRWVVDLLLNVRRLAEVGYGAEDMVLERRAMTPPTADERKLASQLQHDMLRRSDEFLRENPEAHEEAKSWLNANSNYLVTRPRLAGHVEVVPGVYLRARAGYYQPTESLACEKARRHREIDESRQTALVVGAHADKPFRASREIVGILRENAKAASSQARHARRSA